MFWKTYILCLVTGRFISPLGLSRSSELNDCSKDKSFSRPVIFSFEVIGESESRKKRTMSKTNLKWVETRGVRELFLSRVFSVFCSKCQQQFFMGDWILRSLKLSFHSSTLCQCLWSKFPKWLLWGFGYKMSLQILQV